MQKLKGFVACVLVMALLGSVQLSAAQEGGQPFPPNAEDAYVLFPDVIQDAAASAGALQQRYILLARQGNILSVTAAMGAPGLITRMELYDANGVVLVEQAADPASTSFLLSYEVAADGWYFVNVSLSGPVAEPGQYTLALTGTTRAIYDMFGAGAPPPVSGAHLIISTAQVMGTLNADAISYLLPLDDGDALTLSAQGASAPRLRVTQYDNGAAVQTIVAEAPEAGSPARYNTTAAGAQWLRVDVEPTQAGDFVLDVTHPRASGMVQDLGDMASAPTTGPSAGPTGEMCGDVPMRFAVGDVIIVSPEGDNLLLLQDYQGANPASVAMAGTGDLLEVMQPGVCYSSPAYGGQELLYWYVYSESDNASGWIVDSLGGERWVCPQDDPICNQVAQCDTAPAAFNIGDTIVVSQTGDDLQIIRTPSAPREVMALASWKDELQVLGGPVCYHSLQLGKGLWYWHIFSETDNAEGWVVEGIDDQIWVCPLANPTCDQ